MVTKPAHSGCESWLQSVWAMGRHLSQYLSAADAFAAPGTCKQLTPQITVVCDGAVLRGAHKLQPTNAPANKPGPTAHLPSSQPKRETYPVN